MIVGNRLHLASLTIPEGRLRQSIVKGGAFRNNSADLEQGSPQGICITTELFFRDKSLTEGIGQGGGGGGGEEDGNFRLSTRFLKLCPAGPPPTNQKKPYGSHPKFCL